MPYDYQTQRPFVFTEEGQLTNLNVMLEATNDPKYIWFSLEHDKHGLVVAAFDNSPVRITKGQGIVVDDVLTVGEFEARLNRVGSCERITPERAREIIMMENDTYSCRR